MAYFLYHRTHEEDRWRFTFKDQAFLYGCKVGIAANTLRRQIASGQQEPQTWPTWHINVSEAVQQQNATGDVFVIDLKPNQRLKNNEFSFYELVDIWGFSYEEWTPAMLGLRALLIDHKDKDDDLDCHDFTIAPNPEYINEPIFTFVYFGGGIREGKVEGTWRSTGPASANGALLWPDASTYFARIMIDQTSGEE